MASLSKYRKMRDFAKTAEPRGDGHASKRGHSYVIQKHAARRLHYDFRLELDGVLLSWAVPKGPSLDPSAKRLAVETEPHPIEYGGFEGTIPKGQYGGGTVMVWDRGSWEPQGDARSGYAKGHLNFTLHGEKLHGAWHLVRTGQRSADGKNWLLFKSHDDYAREGEDGIVETEPKSAISGRTLEQIATAQNGRVWNSNRAEGGAASTSVEAAPKPRKKVAARVANKATKKRSSALPKTPEPELATLVDAAPEGDEWLHEIKLDGYRILARIDDGEVTLLTRNGNDWTDRMPQLARALSKLSVDSALMDGELVALDDKGISDFQRLQNSLGAEHDGTLVYYAFDLLHVDGEDWRERPLLERKERLRALLSEQGKRVGDNVRFSEHFVGGGAKFFASACKLGLEGILCKRADSPYRGGRGRDWLKVKCGQRQEFVIIGYTDPAGSRHHLGALLLATREGKALTYAGKVGTGFSAESLRALHERLAPIETAKARVTNPPRGADARGVHWVQPELVAEIAFTGFTSDGLLRHPAFHGLREDKPASDVKLEKPAPAAKSAKSTAKKKTKATRAGRKRADPRDVSEYPLSNGDKILYPEQGITKRELLDYYAMVAERMLPEAANRPLTLVRCPNGRGKPCFFQKHPGEGTPEGLRSIAIREKEGKSPYSVIDDAWGLYGLVQLGALEIHTWGSRADDFEHPDLLVFDLDPDPSVDFQAVMDTARLLRSVFESAKLESFVKTTGGKGLHVCVPITPDLDWDQAKDFSGRVASALAARAPDRYVVTQSKAARKGKIFIDYLRNGRGATFIAPYSTRARENAPVAVPLEWDELTPRLDPAKFTVRTLERRLAKLKQDPFERMSGLKQRLRP